MTWTVHHPRVQIGNAAFSMEFSRNMQNWQYWHQKFSSSKNMPSIGFDLEISVLSVQHSTPQPSRLIVVTEVAKSSPPQLLGATTFAFWKIQKPLIPKRPSSSYYSIPIFVRVSNQVFVYNSPRARRSWIWLWTKQALHVMQLYFPVLTLNLLR